jgi:hypothetical protein
MKRPSWASRVAMGSDADLGSLQKACAPPASCAYNDSDADLLAAGQTVGQPTRTVRDMSDLTHAPDATIAAVHGHRFCPDMEGVTGFKSSIAHQYHPWSDAVEQIASDVCATYAQERHQRDCRPHRLADATTITTRPYNDVASTAMRLLAGAYEIRQDQASKRL